LLTDIASESERLQRMIENLLILARVEGGAGVAESGPVLLQRVLPAVIERERAMWPGLTISSEVAVALPPVSGDEASLALVLGNLISNAGKYAGPDACVTIEVERESDGEVAVRVLDDGPGINEADAGRLFDLYFRSKESRTVPGSGIGLFVSQHLVGAMGGRMWARARTEGGAEFGFTLPLYEDQDQPAVVVRPAIVAGGRPAAAIAPIRSFPA